VDAVGLTGGLARSERLVEWITGSVGFLAPVHVLPIGEMAALAAGARAALCGDEPIRTY
jgi:butyrate kinase